MPCADTDDVFARSRLAARELLGVTPPPVRPRPCSELAPAADLNLAYLPVADYEATYRAIIEAAARYGRVRLYARQRHRRAVEATLAGATYRRGRVRVVGDVTVDSVWMRDLAPTPIVAEGRLALVDGAYPSDREGPADVASQLCRALGGHPVYRHRLLLDGGNLVGNGRGLYLTSSEVPDANDLSRRATAGVLRAYYGATRTVFLEALVGDVVDHVDLFATFARPDTVLLGAYTPAQDLENSAILDRNARRLARLRLPGGRPLRVVRVPMADHAPPPSSACGPVVRSYVNLAAWNGVVLVPVYRHDRRTRGRALRIIRESFPDRDVVPVPCDGPAVDGGAVHCLTHALPLVAHPPRARPRRAIGTRSSDSPGQRAAV